MISLGGLTVTPVRAGKGDCIKISYDSYNIIVDSGPPSAAGEFRTTCNSILSNGGTLDVLILTHYDEDHIGGILKVGDLGFRDIYFNAYNGKEESTNLSAAQNQRLFHFLPSSKTHSCVMAKEKIVRGEGSITVHAPTTNDLRDAMTTMAEADVLLGRKSDWSLSLDELMEQEYPGSDQFVSNRASIVFTLDYMLR